MAFHKININSTDFELAPQLVKPTTIETSEKSFPIPFLSGLGSTDGLIERTIYTDTANNFYYNPSTNTLTTTNFNGTATNATYINVAATNTTDASYWIQFVNGVTGNRKSYTDINLYYNPKHNVLTVGQVNGKLNGSVQTTSTNTNASYYISFVNDSGNGMRYSYVNSSLYYNPSTNTLTTTQVNANLNGAVQTTNTSTSASYYISFVNASATGMRYSYVDSHLYYNPSTNLLKIDSGKVEATNGFYETSDERLKNFQEDIEVNFSYLHNIPKKYYYWKDDATYIRHIGTSAQEVQKYYPELVNIDDDGYLTMNYDKLSVVALKAIDILHEEVTELKKENEELKERLARLEELILNK
jgi:hypothetical protein